jgi:hypothetical protein
MNPGFERAAGRYFLALLCISGAAQKAFAPVPAQTLFPGQVL